MYKTKDQLRREINRILKKQGYKVKDGGFILKDNERGTKRSVHNIAKAERIAEKMDFILDNVDIARSTLINGKNLDVEKINPEIIEVESGTKWEVIFRWWNLVWWSLPYERAYGRQMRFLIWDKYHNAVIGLIGLQSPILSWSVRDSYLNIPSEGRDYWVNQSMSAQRLGAMPPYNDILGGKLVSLLLTADIIREKFKYKYKNKKTLMKNQSIPANLLFITTTGAYGKSSIYNRLKYNDDKVVEFIGETQGAGSFHIPNYLYEDLIKYLDRIKWDVSRGYGSGPSRKLRIINQALNRLGFTNGSNHGVKRAVYLFPLARNLNNVINKNKRPIWYHRSVSDITNFWKNRWAVPRAEKNKKYKSFLISTFMKESISNIKNCTNNK